MRGAKGWVLHCPLLQVCWGLSPQSWHPCHPCHDLASLPSLPSLLGPTTAAGAGLGVSFVLLWSLMCTPRAAGTGGSLGGSSQLPMRRLKPQTCNRAVLALLVVYNFLTLLKGLAVPEQLCGDSELRDRHWWQCGWCCDPTEHPVGFSQAPQTPPMEGARLSHPKHSISCSDPGKRRKSIPSSLGRNKEPVCRIYGPELESPEQRPRRAGPASAHGEIPDLLNHICHP